ncbi:MAG: thioredoxin [Rickettsiales bacterium]|nr:thioredoxin [Rickettsiales bacterium]
MMSKVLEINNDNFNEEVNENKDTLIIDFWAEWCGPCKLLSPIIEELAKEFEGKIYFAKVNLDNNQDLAMKFSIRSIPTLLLFKKGQLKDTKVGLLSKSDLKDWILSVD